MRHFQYLVPVGWVLWVLLAENFVAAQPPAASPAVIIFLEGPVGPVMVQTARRCLERARRWNSPCVIFQIDSPGGLLSESFTLAEMFQQIGWTRPVIYIPREALSGAAIAALGCPEIYIAPDARFGNAGTIYLSEEGLFRHVPEKIRSDVALRLRQLAEHHNRPGALAEALVDDQLRVFAFRHQDTGEVQYFTEREWQARHDRDVWNQDRPVPESGEGRFLEVTGQRAVELGLASATVTSREELWQVLRLSAPAVELRTQTIDYAVVVLNHPLVTGLLLVVGLVALYVELSSPGIGLGGLVTLLCFALFFWSRFLGGTAGWLELLVFVVGILFLAIEIFFLPGLGVFGITGVLLIVSGLLLASHEFVVPRTNEQRHQMVISLIVLTVSAMVFVAAVAILTRYFRRVPLLNRLILEPPREVTASTVSGDSAPLLVGDIGIAQTPLRPGGKASFGSAYLDVVTDSEFVEAGQTVKVVEVTGNRIVVRPIEESQKSA